MVHFAPAEPWADGAYTIEVVLDGDVFACDLGIPIDANSTCSLGVPGGADDPRIPEAIVIHGQAPEEEIRVTIHRDGVLWVDEVSSDFEREDHEVREARKVCAEWTTVHVTVPVPQ